VSATHKSPDPYRLFFPLGLFLGFAGLAVWPLIYFFNIQGYWGFTHAFLQSDGFLFCFIVGFLLTALPRFTGTENPAFGWQIAMAIGITVGAIALELQSYVIAHSAFVIVYLIFFGLVSGRVIRRDRKPPETFSLIGLGVLAGFIGCVLNALAAFGIVGDGWVMAGKRSLTEGMTLLLVLGVGGFLGPGLLGFNKLPLIQVGGLAEQPKRRVTNRTLYLIAGVVILLSIIMEYVADLPWLSILRAAVSTAVLSLALKPWKFPLTRSTLSWCVWYAMWLTITGLWLAALWPVYRVEMLHVMFIGGFTLLILAVGMRVTLSHGGHGFATEQKNWPLRIGLILGTIAMLSRVGAAFSPDSSARHLMYASLLLIVALMVWGWRILRLMYGRAH
jgi:uncharacterized protein involved in response to NO